MNRLHKEGIFVTSRRSIYIQTKSDIIYSIQQRGIKGVKQSLSVLACCKPKGICSLAQIETSKTEVLQMPSAMEVFQENLEFFREIEFFKKKLNFKKMIF